MNILTRVLFVDIGLVIIGLVVWLCVFVWNEEASFHDALFLVIGIQSFIGMGVMSIRKGLRRANQ